MPNPTENEFMEFLAETLMADNINLAMDEPFPPLLFDSTGSLMLAMGVEDKFGISIPINQIMKFKTPREIYDYLRSH